MTLAALTGAVQIIRSDSGDPLAFLIRSDHSAEDTEREWNDAVEEALDFGLTPASEPTATMRGEWELFLLAPDLELLEPGTILEEPTTTNHYIRRWTATLGEDADEWLCLETTDTFSAHEMAPWTDFKVISLG